MADFETNLGQRLEAILDAIQNGQAVGETIRDLATVQFLQNETSPTYLLTSTLGGRDTRPLLKRQVGLQPC
jgi:hypothetical protein